MTEMTPDQIVALTEGLVIVLGIAITWAIYHGSGPARGPVGGTSPPPGPDPEATSDASRSPP